MWNKVFEIISSELDRDFQPREPVSLSGGSTCEAFRISDGRNHFFVKRHCAKTACMFEGEYEALVELNTSGTLNVPLPLAWGITGDRAWLVTKYLEMYACSASSQFELGRQLARLHQIKRPWFGWHRDNTLGSTQQPNPRCDDWIEFWRNNRLASQCQMAERKGYRFSGTKRLMDQLGLLFDGYTPSPSLLHGDLWHGNIAALKDGTPVVFDPASYYGDAEAEFGMVDLFGGFTHHFQLGYESVRPFCQGFELRRRLYRLYHEMNHLNLFGRNYAESCQASISILIKNIS
ncbi:MAG: fructosamine kinase family protein [Verrucomicrobiota bacterium]|nr:fructosamine kinase family protein [Verrucomicrobiota bacterium]